MRRALTEALYVAKHRQAFGKHLNQMPLMQRQLSKMAMLTEQARTMIYQTAQALAASDEDVSKRPLMRIMTPLIKFRACRDARKVAGDAMEVRGGCGYIEEWSDPRVLRDAHLGSIWEGTSNIVALDVLRAIQREDSLPALRAHVEKLLGAGTPVCANLADLQAERIERAFSFAEAASTSNSAEQARQVATALYNVVTMAGMRWEAKQANMPIRSLFADTVLQHRLAARDPIADSLLADPRLIEWLSSSI
jgi:hypothetical protein